MDLVQSRGKIIAGVSFDIPGMGYRNPHTGLIEGFEADLARAITEKILGVADRVDFHQVIDEQRIQALQNNQVDVVLSQMTITAERAEEVDFSIPYWVTGEGILLPKESNIKDFDDLKGKRIAVTAGSVSLQRMRASLPSLPGATVIPTRLGFEGLEALAKGEADAVSNDLINLTMLQKFCDPSDLYKIVDIHDRFEPKPFGVAVKKGRRPLVNLLNQAIENLKKRGAIDRLLNESISGCVGEAR